MGYDVHITRADHWFENQGQEIQAQEWLAIVTDDPELIPSPENGPYFVIWRGATQYPETWFDWSDGNIDTKFPDKATLRKMWHIANLLGARIQGDDGEIYDETTIEDFDDSYYFTGLGAR
ncbi:MAG: hypothetical protein WCF84_25175 [Anaerolineae bacterium]